MLRLLWCRYERGDKFGKHVDDSVRVGSKETRYTLLIYLSGGSHGKKEATVVPSRAAGSLKGGETLFYGQFWPLPAKAWTKKSS